MFTLIELAVQVSSPGEDGVLGLVMGIGDRLTSAATGAFWVDGGPG